MTDNLTPTIKKMTLALKKKMLECKTYQELAEALIAEGFTFKPVVKPRDCSDNGMERWVCSCGNLMYDKHPYCYKCGAKLLYRG